MVDKFGALEIPVPVAIDSNHAVGDPALWYLASFVKDVLNSTAGTAWRSVAHGNPVKHAFAHDPEKCDVKDRDFPAVFVWRESSDPLRMADDWLTDQATFEILWVFPPAPQVKQSERQSFFNALIKPLMAAFEVGRHPAWRIPGDTDDYVATRGSLLWKRCGFVREFVRRPMISGLTIELYEGSKLRAYDGVKLSIDAVEKHTRDPAVGTSPSELTNYVTHGDFELDVSDPPE